MISFLDYLKEVAESKRKGIVHLEKMKDVDFVRFVQRLDKELGGKIKDIPVSLKVDGLGARVGKDDRGRIFFEGSRTGPVFEPKAFSEYTKSQGKPAEFVARAEHYDDMLDIVQNAEFMRVIPKDTKVFCEILYNPLAEMQDDGFVFVKTKYDKNKLGTLMTIVPLNVTTASTGDDHPHSDEIIEMLYKQSSKKIKIINPKLTMRGTIDVNAIINPVKTLDDEAIRILQSRKKDDKEAKHNLKETIQAVKKELSEFLLKNPKILDKDKLGPDIEGIVLNVNGENYKITTPDFQAKLKQ